MDFQALLNSGSAVVVFAVWAGFGTIALAVTMLVVIAVLRAMVEHRERVHAAAIVRWTEILEGAGDVPVPPLHRRELSGFLQIWNDIHEKRGGKTSAFLEHVARETHLAAHLVRRIRYGGFHTRLVALIAMGYLHDADSFVRIERYLNEKNPIVSLCAARALMQSDPMRAVSRFVPQIMTRGDWSQGSVAAILAEAGPQTVSTELAGATLQANTDTAPRMIRFLAGVDPAAAAPIIRKTLMDSTEERLISTCLQIMTRSEDLDLVRPLLKHQRWHVRMQTAATLGRIGLPSDEALLVGVLADPQWWVRYRAAQALLKMSHVGEAGLRRIAATHADKYARDIVNQVLAEHAMGITTSGTV